ncbi:hypothetical protein EA004_08530 [Vibrio anguillarum]|uniref:Uncharacterized protein n=1 Tax=Vibrio anguillarum TaxID=55601 RepID=A0ABR9Z1F0_VIBAN|nr:hypothetical protein AA909_16605 [Vibrio anguillarum]MBF4245088.1 hypothetical protein [Vibrio anguillarum]MBF4372042.1 hypothetical protein [Vibrio anguillarum]
MYKTKDRHIKSIKIQSQIEQNVVIVVKLVSIHITLLTLKLHNVINNIHCYEKIETSFSKPELTITFPKIIQTP